MNKCKCGHTFNNSEFASKTTPHLYDSSKSHIHYFCPYCGLLFNSEEIDTTEEMVKEYQQDGKLSEAVDHAKRNESSSQGILDNSKPRLNYDQRLALLEAGYNIQAQITKLEKGKPIAIAKARNQSEQIKATKKYNEQIKALRAQLKAINDAIFQREIA